MKAIKTLAIVTSAILMMANALLQLGGEGLCSCIQRRRIERLLGPSLNARNIYKLKDMIVVIQYSDGSCEKCWPFGWNVPVGTVVTITIRPTGKLDLADSGLNLSAYKRMKGHRS